MIKSMIEPKPTTPGDFALIAEKYAHPLHVRMLRALRKYSRTRVRVMVNALGLSEKKIFAYEKLNQLFPRNEFALCEDFIIDVLMEQGKFPPKTNPKVSRPSGKKIEQAVLWAKLGMTPPQLLTYYRDFLNLKNKDVGQMLGYTRTHIQKVISGNVVHEQAYQAISSLLMRLVVKEEASYDEYY